LAPALVVSVTPRYSLRIFLDLGYLVRYQTMRLAVDGHRRFLVRSFRKAEEGVGRNLRAFGLPMDNLLKPTKESELGSSSRGEVASCCTCRPTHQTLTPSRRLL
jgi:hypothetical protein